MFFFFFPEISPPLKMKIPLGGDRQNIENTRYTVPSVINIPLKILKEVIWSTIWQVISIKIILLRKNKNSNAFDGMQMA